MATAALHHVGSPPGAPLADSGLLGPSDTDAARVAGVVMPTINELVVNGRLLKEGRLKEGASVASPSHAPDAPGDSWKKMPEYIKNKFEVSLQELLKLAIIKLGEQGLVPSGQSYDIRFRLTEAEGFVVNIVTSSGGISQDVKVAEYKDFLQGDKGFWKTLPLFSEKITPFQEFLSATKETTAYVKGAGLGKRVVEQNATDATAEKRVAKVAAEAFKEIADDILKTRKELLKNSFFQRHKEWFIVGTNSCSVISKICSAFPDNPLLMMASGLFGFLKGTNFIVYNSTTFREKAYLGKLGLEKHNILEKLLMGNGLINGILVALTGLTLFLAGLCLELCKKTGHAIFMSINHIIGACIFGYVFANLFALGWVIFDSFRAYRSIMFRKELNSFLENSNLTPREKYLGYLKKVREKITLTAEEENKIKEKVISDVKKRLKKKNPGITEAEIKTAMESVSGEIEAEVVFEKKAMVKRKVEELQKLTLKSTTEKIIGSNGTDSLIYIDSLIFDLEFGVTEDAAFAVLLNKSKVLVQEIDKASYQNLVSHYVYVGIAVLCLLGNLLLLTACPWAPAIWWMTISLLYLVWDYSRTNIYFTGLIYDKGFFGYGSRRKKVDDILDDDVRTPVVAELSSTVEQQPLIVDDAAVAV